MPPIGVHHTATVDEPWDGPAEEAKLANDAGAATFRRMYAWVDPEGDEATKAAYKFPHHSVDADGNPGAANLAGCRAIKQRLGQSDIPAGDQDGVAAHADAHLADGQPASAGQALVAAPRSYAHVTKAIFERPWALQPQMLSFMADLVRFRSAGGKLGDEEISERLAAAAAQNGDRAGGATMGPIAVIPMYGVITQRANLMSAMSGGTSVDELRSQLREALNDPAISAIVFDVDSPGGSVDAITEFATEIRQARDAGGKPIVAQVNTLAASAAYWLASQANEIVVTPSGSVGSIGVFAAHEDDSAALEAEGVKITLISAGQYKTEGNPYQPLDDQARAAIQDQVDTFYGMFLADVAKGRAATVDQIATDYGQGREVLAKKALAAGMVDRIDTLENTVGRLARRPSSARRVAEAPVPSITAIAAAAPKRRPVSRDEFPALLARGGNR